MKKLALVACLFVTTLFATESKHYLQEDCINVFQGEIRYIFHSGESISLKDIHSDENGVYITDSDIADTYIAKGRHTESNCHKCGDHQDDRWADMAHRNDFQCRSGPQGCAENPNGFRNPLR